MRLPRKGSPAVHRVPYRLLAYPDHMTTVTKGAFVLEDVVGMILGGGCLEILVVAKVLYTVNLYDRGRVDDLDIETPRVPFGVTLVPIGRGKLGLTNETGCFDMVVLVENK